MSLTFHHEFAQDQSLAGRIGAAITHTRASDGTYFDSSGVLQVAASNVARYDHNPDTLEPLGVLKEAAFENEVPNSADVTAWVGARNVSVVRNQTSIDGTANATLVTDNATSAAHNVHTVQLSNVTGLVRYVIVKKGTARYCVVSTSATPETSSSLYSYVFDFDTETFTAEGSAQTKPATWKKLSNGFYLLAIYHNASGSTTNRVSVGLANGPNHANISYSGAGDTLIVFGGQYGVGNTPSSFIYTGATPATDARAIDVYGTSDVSWHSTAGGTLIAKATIDDVSAVSQAICGLSDGGASDYVALSGLSTPDGRGTIRAVNSTKMNVSAPYTIQDETPFHILLGYKVNSGFIYVEGSAAAEDTTIDALPTNMNRFDIGVNYAQAVAERVHVDLIRYYDEQLSVADMAAYSQGNFPTDGAILPSVPLAKPMTHPLMNQLTRRK